MKNIIKINDDFEMHRDKYQWILWHWSDGISKKEETKGQKIRVKRETYHGDLKQVCREILDRRAGECETLAEIRDLLENAADVLTSSLESKISHD